MRSLYLPALCAGLLFAVTVHAQTAVSAADAGAKPVIAKGLVPDEATKQAVLARLREIYGSGRVVDSIEVGSVVAPPNWREKVVSMIAPDLQQVSSGELEINGNAVRVSGNVDNELQRQQVVSGLATRINNQTYSVDGKLLKVNAKPVALNDKLKGRIIEFESGSATLKPTAIPILDEMAAAIKAIGGRPVQVIGHTDNSGNRIANVNLSLMRAEAVKNYLVQQRGISADTLIVRGSGPDQPVADNTTPEGRSRNRRIEFKEL